jgi:hypothetical protein
LVAIVVAALGASALPAHAADPARDRSCGWILEPSADRENVLFPDTGTRYLGALIPAPPGGYVEIKGQFPYARYMSLQTYSHTLQTASDLYDQQIQPDPGSSNPYLPGADRTNPNRGYTVRVVAGQEPASGGAPNTLYETSADGTKTGFGMAYRIYLPDRTAGPFGGVPAPSLTIVLADGTRIPLPQCPDLIPDVGLTQALGGLGLSDHLLPPVGLLALHTPVWHKYVNAPTSYALGLTENELIPQAIRDLINQVTVQLPSGLGENAHIKYVYSYLSQEFGKVVEFRAKMPTTPRTREGEPTMGGGQLRYWSMCTANRTTQTYGCAVDEDVAVDKDGYFTVAISTAANRPANAVPQCGVAWLPWGPDPKGIVFLRNMLPSADFDQAVQNATPGTEQQTMGEYYPVGRYYSTPSDFEQQVGCQPPSTGATAVAAAKKHSKKHRKHRKHKKHKRKKPRRA